MRNLLMLLVIVACSEAGAETGFTSAQFNSGDRHVPLLELFTSEGCSSCPPADQWFSALKSDAQLWQNYVPVAFHVDYWNYIGWPDRFADSAYTDRQQQYVQDGKARVAYTPGFFVAGNEWAGWFSGDAHESSSGIVGDLGVAIDGSQFAVHFAPADSADGQLLVHLALLGMNLSSEIAAGENRGKSLHHDFVVLDVQSHALQQSGNLHKITGNLDPVATEATEFALAAWISDASSQTPIQAVGGYLSQRSVRR